jgi:hypothetical protein
MKFIQEVEASKEKIETKREKVGEERKKVVKIWEDVVAPKQKS